MEILLIDFKLELDNIFNEKHLNNILAQYYTDSEELQSKDIPWNPIIYLYLIETLLLMLITYYDIQNLDNYNCILIFPINQLYNIYLVDMVSLNSWQKCLYDNECLFAMVYTVLWFIPSFYYNGISYNYYNGPYYTGNYNSMVPSFLFAIILVVLNTKYLLTKTQLLTSVKVRYSYKYRVCIKCNKAGGNNWVEYRDERKKIHLECIEL